MTDRERYLFDVQGWLVIPGVLTEEEVERVHAALDANRERRGTEGDRPPEDAHALRGERERGLYRGVLTWPQPWCQPFRDLLVHPTLIGYLDEVLGRGWHVDHHPEVFDCAPGADGQELHFGDPYVQPGAWYWFRGGIMRSGMVVVEYVLTDQPEGGGGFCAIPGSHKASFARPRDVSLLDTDRDAVRNPGARAGDVILFTEGLAHGALPWTNDHDRRVAIYRYCEKTVQYARGFHQVVLPDWVQELSAAQRAVLEPAGFYEHAIVGRDGTVSRPWAEYEPGPSA